MHYEDITGRHLDEDVDSPHASTLESIFDAINDHGSFDLLDHDLNPIGTLAFQEQMLENDSSDRWLGSTVTIYVPGQEPEFDGLDQDLERRPLDCALDSFDYAATFDTQAGVEAFRVHDDDGHVPGTPTTFTVTDVHEARDLVPFMLDAMRTARPSLTNLSSRQTGALLEAESTVEALDALGTPRFATYPPRPDMIGTSTVTPCMPERSYLDEGDYVETNSSVETVMNLLDGMSPDEVISDGSRIVEDAMTHFSVDWEHTPRTHAYDYVCAGQVDERMLAADLGMVDPYGQSDFDQPALPATKRLVHEVLDMADTQQFAMSVLADTVDRQRPEESVGANREYEGYHASVRTGDDSTFVETADGLPTGWNLYERRCGTGFEGMVTNANGVSVLEWSNGIDIQELRYPTLDDDDPRAPHERYHTDDPETGEPRERLTGEHILDILEERIAPDPTLMRDLSCANIGTRDISSVLEAERERQTSAIETHKASPRGSKLESTLLSTADDLSDMQNDGKTADFDSI